MRRGQDTILPYDFKNKDKNTKTYIMYMLNRLQSMFIYKGLPDTIKQRSLELNNMTHGLTVWCYIDEGNIVQDEESKHLPGGVYALWGDIGGVIDLNYDMTYATIAHPRLKNSLRLKIGEECVIMRNDSLMLGLLPILERYNTLINEADISLYLASIQARATALITAGDDKTKINAETYINKIFNGELSVIGELSSLEGFQGIKTQPYLTDAGNQITNLIELHSYLWGREWQELGVDFADNKKREIVVSGEIEQNKPQLRPLIDDMLHCRELALEEINKMFNLNIEVSLHSAWLDTQEAHEVNDADNNMELDNEEVQEIPREDEQSEPEEKAESVKENSESDSEPGEPESQESDLEGDSEAKAEAVDEIKDEVIDVLEAVKEAVKEEVQDE